MTTELYTVNSAANSFPPAAVRLLQKLAPRFERSNNLIVAAPLPPEIANAPRPPKLESYQRELEIGTVVHFKSDKCFGHLDTESGHLFFHASGYRVPGLREHIEDGRVRHMVQLERLPKGRGSRLQLESGTLPPVLPPHTEQANDLFIPKITAGDSVLFLRGTKDSPTGIKHLAQLWTLQQPYEAFLAEQTAIHEARIEEWRRLCKYRLELVIDGGLGPQGLPLTYTSILFDGTETMVLKDWYQYYSKMLNLNASRKITLSYSEYNESIGHHAPYVECDEATTHDFLGD